MTSTTPDTGPTPTTWLTSDRALARFVGRPASSSTPRPPAASSCSSPRSSRWCGRTRRGAQPTRRSGTPTCRSGSAGSRSSEDLRHWVNDGLMALFFFVVGLEIKRELVHGELREPRAAALPADRRARRHGGAGPALPRSSTAGGDGASGLGHPDGDRHRLRPRRPGPARARVPASLKLFLLTLAIVDDIGAIVVIAVFYASDVQPWLRRRGGRAAGRRVVLRRAGVVWLAPYVVLGVGVWLATYESGVHATIAGVVLGLLTPAQPLARPRRPREWASDLTRRPDPDELDAMTPTCADLGLAGRAPRAPAAPVDQLRDRAALRPRQRRGRPHGDASRRRRPRGRRSASSLGLVVGKIVGITAASWSAVRLRDRRLPRDSLAQLAGSPPSPASASPCRCSSPTWPSSRVHRGRGQAGEACWRHHDGGDPWRHLAPAGLQAT